MNPLSVLSAKTWQTLFSEVKYQQAVIDKKNVVDFLVVLGKPDNEIMQQVREHPLCLKESTNALKLSVLDLAIMKGRETLVAELLDSGASVNEPDLFGWLPVHHAALAGDAIFQRVVKGGANPNIKTAAGATCEDIRRYAGIDELTSSLSKLLIGNEKPQSPFSVAEFDMEKYTDCPYYADDSLQILWQTKPSELFPACIEKVDKALNCGIKTSLRKTQTGWGLFAEEPIKFDQYLFPYSGRFGAWTDKMDLSTGLMAQKTWQPYQLGSINAQTVGNVARFANEGFPNSMIMALPLYRGCEHWYLLVACEKEGIAVGEEILWDYGIGECLLKWNSLYHIPNKEAMRLFIKSNSLQNIDSFMKAHSLRFNPQMPFTEKNHSAHQLAESYLTKLYYCFHTPAAVIDLWCESLITAKDWFEAMSSFEQKQNRFTEPTQRKVLFLTYVFMQMLIKLETALTVQAPKRIKPIKAWIAALSTKLTMLELSEVCIDINRWLDEPVRDSWDDFSEKLAKKHIHQPGRDISSLTIMRTYAKANSTL